MGPQKNNRDAAEPRGYRQLTGARLKNGLEGAARGLRPRVQGHGLGQAGVRPEVLAQWSKRASSALRSPGFRLSSGTQLGNGVDGRGEIHSLQKKQVPVFMGN